MNFLFILRLIAGTGPWKRQLEQVIAPKQIALCKVARVMLLKILNTQRGQVNGATGTAMAFLKTKDVGVMSICDAGLLPVVKFDLGMTKVIKTKTWDVTEGDPVVAQREQQLSHWLGLQAFTSARA